MEKRHSVFVLLFSIRDPFLPCAADQSQDQSRPPTARAVGDFQLGTQSPFWRAEFPF